MSSPPSSSWTRGWRKGKSDHEWKNVHVKRLGGGPGPSHGQRLALNNNDTTCKRALDELNGRASEDGERLSIRKATFCKVDESEVAATGKRMG